MLDIGLCGDTFMLKNKNQITIEWQVKHITNESIYVAKEKISEQYPLNNFSSPQKQKDVNELLAYINDNYYLCALLIFCNNNCINNDPSKSFSRSYSIQCLKDIGERFIQQKKLKILANDH